MLMLAALLIGTSSPVGRLPRATPEEPSRGAQPADTIAVNLDVRTEGRATRDEGATRLLGEVRRRPRSDRRRRASSRADHARRTIWIVTGATPGSSAASMIVTERYDRETLMVLGIEDDDMAERMMALQIVVDHQIFTGRDPAALAQRIVTAINDGIFAKLRTLKPKP